MSRDPLKTAQDIGREAAKIAKSGGFRPDSWKYASVIRGHWQVAAREHPEIANYRAQFYKAAGVGKVAA